MSNEHDMARQHVHELLGRVQAVELELQFSQKELEETRQLYKKLEHLFRDSDQMIGRLSTLISVQEEVIKHLQSSVEQKTTVAVSDIEQLKVAVKELEKFEYKALGIIIAIGVIGQVLLYFL